MIDAPLVLKEPDYYKLGARPKVRKSYIQKKIESDKNILENEIIASDVVLKNDIEIDPPPNIEPNHDEQPKPEIDGLKHQKYIEVADPILALKNTSILAPTVILSPSRGNIKKGLVAGLKARFERGGGGKDLNEINVEKADLKRLKRSSPLNKSLTSGQKRKRTRKSVLSKFDTRNQPLIDAFFRGQQGRY